MFENELLELFKVVLLDENQAVTPLYYKDAAQGYITNFVPSTKQKVALIEAFEPIDFFTLFSVKERESTPMDQLIYKQIAHYFEVNVLDAPGIFQIPMSHDRIATIAYVKGVDKAELTKMVQNLLYTNAPIKKTKELMEIIKGLDIPYNLQMIQNNEMRVRLYRESDTFTNGDDAVRYIVYTATDDTLLIKSKDVISKVSGEKNRIQKNFLARHANVLATVFNRHKPIIMALKNSNNKSVINQISRWSKKRHQPLPVALNKTFISRYFNNEFDQPVLDVLSHVSVRDKLKYLNLLAIKGLHMDMDVFNIRNGKVFLKKNTKTYRQYDISALVYHILHSLRTDLSHLNGKNILLDPQVNYGLPVSQKQTVGNLPFGTEVDVAGNTVCSGIYWENKWGARDLDLSTINTDGERVGWGRAYSYSNMNDITFSGDVVDAQNGAMEFMASYKTFDVPYGLFVNIFTGESGCKAEVVVGSKAKGRWIDEPVIREKITLNSRESVIGFVRNGKFIVYQGRLTNNRVSGANINKVMAQKGNVVLWTVQDLFNALGIEYDVVQRSVNYDYNLSYSGFTIDKLENMLFNR